MSRYDDCGCRPCNSCARCRTCGGLYCPNAQCIQCAPGAPGPMGPQGPTGPAGTSMTILGSYESVEALEREHETGSAGDSYLVNGYLYVWNVSMGAWKNVGKIQGPEGPAGRQGVAGQMGPTGPAGLRGPQGSRGVDGPSGPMGPSGPQGMQGPVAATIPFSVGKYGIPVSTNSRGQPSTICFSGFSASGYYNPEYLQEGEWESRKITVTEYMDYGPAFVVPYDAKLKKIHFLLSLETTDIFDAGIVIRPFVCLAISNAEELVYDVLEDTITYVDPFVGGITYNRHTLRRGAALNLDIDLPEGTLVAIMMGILSENSGEGISCNLALSGGIYLQ